MNIYPTGQTLRRFHHPLFFTALVLCSTTYVVLGCPQQSDAQFLSPSNRGSSTISDRARERTLRQQKGANITEWVRRLSNDKPETRLDAVKSLGDSKDPKAIEHLMSATADVDIRVKVKAIEYLGNLRATDATPMLVQQLFLREVVPGVKQKILVALGKIGDPRGAEPIMEFLKRRLDTGIKATGLFALREVGNDTVLAYLDTVSRTDPSQPLRQLAADAASSIRHRLSPESAPVVPTFVKQVELRQKAERGESQ
ncbi:MAG: HEAT repeat domain-containing protein [Candidatus Binatia bacterium]